MTGIPELTADEYAAALRFQETCQDSGSYGITQEMLLRLAELGLVSRGGGGWYETTPLLARACNRHRFSAGMQAKADALDGVSGPDSFYPSWRSAGCVDDQAKESEAANV